MKINTTLPVVNLAGKPYKDQEEKDVQVGPAIANVLAASTSGGKMKMYILAKRFYEEAEIDIDDADVALVKKTIEESNAYNVIILGQLLMLLG